jgi:RNA polymerase sigma-70 factor (ECF subfamily)
MHEWSREGATAAVPDELLMARYAAGDAEAFECLFARYEPRVLAFFLKRTGSREDAEDLYQELFLRIHRARWSYDAARPFSPWLFRIAHRLAVDDARRAFRRREVPLAGPEPRSAGPDGEHSAAIRTELRDAFAELTPEESYVLLSAKGHGLRYDELAVQLGKSVAAIKQMA